MDGSIHENTFNTHMFSHENFSIYGTVLSPLVCFGHQTFSLVYTHTHAHTHTRTHAHMHTHTHTCTHVHTYTCTHTHIHTQIHAVFITFVRRRISSYIRTHTDLPHSPSTVSDTTAMSWPTTLLASHTNCCPSGRDTPTITSEPLERTCRRSKRQR